MPDGFADQFRFGEPRPLAVLGLEDRASAGDSDADSELSDIFAAELEDSRSRFKKLPDPSGPYPFRMRLGDVIGRANVRSIQDAGTLVFHTVGDTGQRSHGAE